MGLFRKCEQRIAHTSLKDSTGKIESLPSDFQLYLRALELGRLDRVYIDIQGPQVHPEVYISTSYLRHNLRDALY